MINQQIDENTNANVNTNKDNKSTLLLLNGERILNINNNIVNEQNGQSDIIKNENNHKLFRPMNSQFINNQIQYIQAFNQNYSQSHLFNNEVNQNKNINKNKNEFNYHFQSQPINSQINSQINNHYQQGSIFNIPIQNGSSQNYLIQLAYLEGFKQSQLYHEQLMQQKLLSLKQSSQSQQQQQQLQPQLQQLPIINSIPSTITNIPFNQNSGHNSINYSPLIKQINIHNHPIIDNLQLQSNKQQLNNSIPNLESRSKQQNNINQVTITKISNQSPKQNYHNPFDDQIAVAKLSPAQYDDEKQQEQHLIQCPQGCGRKFNEIALEKHVGICEKIFQDIRKKYYQHPNQNQASDSQNAHNKLEKDILSSYRNKLKQMEDLKQMKVSNRLIKCQICGRKFNEESGQRHIKFCEEQKKRQIIKDFKKY